MNRKVSRKKKKTWILALIPWYNTPLRTGRDFTDFPKTEILTLFVAMNFYWGHLLAENVFYFVLH